VSAATFSLAFFVACEKPLDTNRVVEGYTSFGEAVYREGCQRVAYTGQLAEKAAGTRQTVDVSGALGRAVCVDNTPAPVDAPAKLKALQAQRESLIPLIDAILPSPILSDLQRFLESLMPLADDGTMEAAIAGLGKLLGLMRDDPDFAPALARIAHRNGYRPTKTAAGLVHTIVEYPRIDDFLDKVLNLVGPGGTAETEWKAVLRALSRELKTAQPVANPADPERTLRLALNLVFSTNPALGSGKARPLVARDYRGIAQAALTGGRVAAPFVDKNNDGLADVDDQGRYVDANGAPLDVPSPFPEAGVADSAPRDSLGRALASSGTTATMYKYLDLDPTVIGGLAREGVALMDSKKDITLGLMHGASALLGPRKTQTKMYMDSAGAMMDAYTFEGFDIDQAAVLDMVHAFIQILGDPNASDTLLTAKTLLTKYEAESTRAIGAMLDASDRGKKYPNAKIPETSTLYDDLIPIVVRLLRVPGLFEDVMTALEDPKVRGFAPMIARLLVAKNQIDFDHANGPHFPLVGGNVALDSILPVDRTKPDVDWNRSLLQRIAHLIHSANGVPLCNKKDATVSMGPFTLAGPYAKCDLFEIDDLALFFILNMSSVKNDSRYPSAYNGANFAAKIKPDGLRGFLDNSLGDIVLQGQTKITGFTRRPTPAALVRTLFLRPNEMRSLDMQFLLDTMEPVATKDGELFFDVHDKSITAWETRLPTNPNGRLNDTFYDAVQPLVDAFAKHDECIEVNAQTGNCTKTRNAAKIFVDILATLHEHWGSPQSSYNGKTFQSADPRQPRFAYPDNVVSYEQLLAEILSAGDLMPATLDLVPILNRMTIDGTTATQPARPVLLAAARYLLDPGATPPGVAYRNGATTTTTSDGKKVIPRATPYHLLADAYAHKRAALAATDPAKANAWKAATSALVDQMLTVEVVNGKHRMKNRRVHAVTQILIDFLRDRLAMHAKKGDLDDWVHKQLTKDVTDVMGGPTFAALADFVSKVQTDTEARTQLYDLLQYLVDEAQSDLAFATALTTLADQVQTMMADNDLVPILRVVGEALDPDGGRAQGAIDAQLTLVKKSRQMDDRKVLLTILRNLYRTAPDGTYPASTLADQLAELNRTRPGQGGTLDAGDYKTLLGEISDFFLDEKRGFTRFVNIAKMRGPKN
jgi:hypothetical protein